jgi:hypothetical protein
MKNKLQIIVFIIGIIFLNSAAKKIFPYDLPSIATKIISFTPPAMVVKNDPEFFTFFNVTCSIKNLGNAEFEITLTSKETPTIKVPDYVLDRDFYDEPIDNLRGIFNFTKSSY